MSKSIIDELEEPERCDCINNQSAMLNPLGEGAYNASNAATVTGQQVATRDDSGLTSTEILDFKVPERKDFLGGWLKSQSLNLISAARGCGKTWMSLLIAGAVASGKSLGCWKGSGVRRNVLYVDGEMVFIDLQGRVKLLRASFGDALDNITFHSPDLKPNGIMPNLDTPQGRERVGKWADKYDLIVIDNLSSLCRSNDENEAKGWQGLQDWLVKLRSAGKAVIIVHHFGKNGTQRGTSKREDALDTSIVLKLPDDYDNDLDDGARFHVIFTKNRMCRPKHVEAEFSLSTNNDILSVEMKTLANNTAERIKELSREGMTQMEIAFELGISRSKVKRTCERAGITLVDNRRIDAHLTRKNGKVNNTRF